MIANPRIFRHPARPVEAASSARPWGALMTLLTWLERRRERRALLELSDHMLKDIGVSRADAWAEGSKPFWRP
jgi:uncharacterized protein YjiS (DUF1127 family)